MQLLENVEVPCDIVVLQTSSAQVLPPDLSMVFIRVALFRLSFTRFEYFSRYMPRESLLQGVCYVQTTNLDGETNFKLRRALPETQSIPLRDLEAFQGVIQCAAPNADLYGVD